jgi:hypothetical protein
MAANINTHCLALFFFFYYSFFLAHNDWDVIILLKNANIWMSGCDTFTLTYLSFQIVVFWDLKPDGLLCGYQRFHYENGGNKFLRNVGKQLRYNPEDHNLNRHRRETLGPHITFPWFPCFTKNLQVSRNGALINALPFCCILNSKLETQ